MTSDPVAKWFAEAPEGQKPILNELRAMVKSLDPHVLEEIKWGRPCYSTQHMLFCYFQSTKNHVSLGFQNGASLDDPQRLLQGTGKNMRHIKLGAKDESSRSALLALLQQAWSRAS